ncbi:Uncharacterized protein APZ42_002782, partial [Daphnia magna]
QPGQHLPPGAQGVPQPATRLRDAGADPLGLQPGRVQLRHRHSGNPAPRAHRRGRRGPLAALHTVGQRLPAAVLPPPGTHRPGAHGPGHGHRALHLHPGHSAGLPARRARRAQPGGAAQRRRHTD